MEAGIVMPEDLFQNMKSAWKGALGRHAFNEADTREIGYIFLVLLMAMSIDERYVELASSICKQCNGKPKAAGTKNFARMFAKLLTDHAHETSPKAAMNVDINRLGWTFERPEDLKAAVALARHEIGSELRMKNNYMPNFDARKTFGYRAMLTTICMHQRA